MTRGEGPIMVASFQCGGGNAAPDKKAVCALRKERPGKEERLPWVPHWRCNEEHMKKLDESIREATKRLNRNAQWRKGPHESLFGRLVLLGFGEEAGCWVSEAPGKPYSAYDLDELGVE
eukprot:1161827-Pelagomonas_calceolata.AAC.15